MFSIIIQNDKKIKIQLECSDPKELRRNTNLLLAVVSTMESAENAEKPTGDTDEEPSYKEGAIYLLVLKEVPDTSAPTACVLKEKLNKSLEEAKGIINSVRHGHEAILILSTYNDSFEVVKQALEEKGCICEIRERV